jgi:uncharacterized protein YcfJ
MTGTAAGARTGALIGGPVGALVGGVRGAAVGATTGATTDAAAGARVAQASLGYSYVYDRNGRMMMDASGQPRFRCC